MDPWSDHPGSLESRVIALPRQPEVATPQVKGSHRRYWRADRDEIITLPWHNRDLAESTLNNILKAARMK
jgi:hypothetical protein